MTTQNTSYKPRIVKIKTVNELQETGWEMNSDGNLSTKLNNIMFNPEMVEKLQGKIVMIAYNKELQNWFIEDKWNITDEMIKEEYNQDDYPEYFI